MNNVRLILSAATFIASGLAASAQPVTVPQPSPGTVQVSPVPIPCAAGFASRWGTDNLWHCEPVGGGGGGAAVCIPDGAVKAICVGGGCTIYKEDCSVLATPGSTTNGLQEAWNYAWLTKKLPFRIQGSDALTFSNITLNVPPQLGLAFNCWGPNLRFTNAAQDGMNIDTQVKSVLDMRGCRISYSGTGRAVLQQPRAALPYIPSQGPTPWTADMRFNFGVIEATGGTPEALFAIDVRQALGTRPDGFDSAEFAANVVSIVGLEGNGFATFNYRVYAPIGPLQIVGQNFFDLGYVQWATLDEIYIGDWQGSAFTGITTNHYTAHLSHFSYTEGSRAIVSNATKDRWTLTALNNYAGSVPGNPPNTNTAGPVYWGPQAQGNRIITTQIIGWNHPTADGNVGGAWPNIICGYSAATAC